MRQTSWLRNSGIATATSLALLISGCVGKVRYPDYHTLSIAPAPPTDPPVSGQPALAVRRFETSAYLRQGRIVYRENPDQIGFYEYHRWASDPGLAVTTAVMDSLRAGHLFASVGPYASEQRPDYLLTGRLEQLDEIDYGGGVKVEARLSAELTDLRTGAIVWAGDASQASKVDQRNVNSVVAEMSAAVQTSVQRLTASMQERVSTTEPKTREAKR